LGLKLDVPGGGEVAETWPKLRGYVCIICGKKMWANKRPDRCPKCGSNVIRKTKEYRYACDNRACKHNVEGLYCKLKEPSLSADGCRSFEPRKK